jgi:outer membrane protein TolC
MSEVLTRRIERIDIEGRIGVTSARLARVLQLPVNVKLIPVERLVVPITLVDNNATMEDLMTQAMANRPDLGAFKEAIAGALAREKRYRYGPFIPKLAIADQVGSFGGGLNDRLAQFGERNQLSAQVFWEIKNFGLGNMAELRERKANVTQANYQLIEAQAKAGAEIVEAAQQSAARAESLEFAKKAVGEAEELYRINKEGTFNVVDAKNLFDALRPLQSIQLLNQARTSYLNAIVEYNRAQYRLFTAIGRAPGTAPK